MWLAICLLVAALLSVSVAPRLAGAAPATLTADSVQKIGCRVV